MSSHWNTGYGALPPQRKKYLEDGALGSQSMTQEENFEPLGSARKQKTDKERLLSRLCNDLRVSFEETRLLN